MKLLRILACSFLLSYASFAVDVPDNTVGSTPPVTAPYLGQSPPGHTPALFAEGIISVEGIQHSVPTFSPDGGEVFWGQFHREEGRPRGEILWMHETDSGWTAPAVAPFSGQHHDTSPRFSPDGQRLYFSSNRPSDEGAGRALWYVQREATGWSDPIRLPSPLNGELRPTNASITDDGELVFSGRLEGVQWNSGIYSCRMTDDEIKPQLLDSTVNTEYADAYPFIAPDGSYLLFGSSRPGAASTETDLYMLVRRSDGAWSEPLHLDGTINNGKTVSFASVTIDGRYLFFNRFDDDGTDKFYWVDAAVLDSTRAGAGL